MEKKDQKLIEKIISNDDELKVLVEEHGRYEGLLEQYNQCAHLTEMEKIEQKRIKKLKLKGRDRIEEILAKYRQESKT